MSKFGGDNCTALTEVLQDTLMPLFQSRLRQKNGNHAICDIYRHNFSNKKFQAVGCILQSRISNLFKRSGSARSIGVVRGAMGAGEK